MVHSLQQPEHIFWYHNSQVISYYSSRGGISIVRRKGMDETSTMSSLIIREVGQEDQGTYTCRPFTGDFKTARTRLFIDYGGVLGTSISRVDRVRLSVQYNNTSYIMFFYFLILVR